MDFETFTVRLTQALLRNSPTNTNYVLTTTLVNALNEAMRTPDSVSSQYPRMMYLYGARERYITVANAAEEAQHVSEGYVHEALPLYEVGYPQEWVERDLSRGSDYRRIVIRNPQEKQNFKAVVELDEGWGAHKVDP